MATKKTAAKKRTFRRSPAKPKIVGKRAAVHKKTAIKPKKETKSKPQEVVEMISLQEESDTVTDNTREQQSTTTSVDVEKARVEMTTNDQPVVESSSEESGPEVDSPTDESERGEKNTSDEEQPAGMEENKEEGVVPVDDNQVEQDENATVVKENGLRWVLIFIILFLVGLIGGLFFLFLSQNKQSVETATNSSLKTVAVYTPSPTESLANVNKSKFTIKILNGSEKVGLASATKDFLTAKGYTVGSIGNADTSSDTASQIQAKQSVDKSFISALEKDLSEKYNVSNSITSLTASSATDVVVIIGSETK